jgi:hypothetical protein
MGLYAVVLRSGDNVRTEINHRTRLWVFGIEKTDTERGKPSTTLRSEGRKKHNTLKREQGSQSRIHSAKGRQGKDENKQAKEK